MFIKSRHEPFVYFLPFSLKEDDIFKDSYY